MQLAEEILGITQAKSELSGRVKRLESGLLERVVLVRQNHPVAVILSTGEYDRIRAAQEFFEDAMAVLEAKDKDDGTRVSLEEIKAKYGLD
jgi:PHD/YefM family antitoxin component YafN of YafNO toxin-antitoxin module